MWARAGADAARRRSTGVAPAAAPGPQQLTVPEELALQPTSVAREAASSRPSQQRLLPGLSWHSVRPGSASGRGECLTAPADGSATAAIAVNAAIVAAPPAGAPEAASSSSSKAVAACLPYENIDRSGSSDSEDSEFGHDMFKGSERTNTPGAHTKHRACDANSDTGDSQDGGEETGSDADNGTGGTGDDTSDDEPEPAQEKRQRAFFGRAGVSTVARMSAADTCRREDRTKRPSHAEYALTQCAPDRIRSLVIDDHKCHHSWSDEDETVQCHHQLWARSVTASVEALRQARSNFLALGTKERGNAVLAALSFDESMTLHAGAGAGVAWKPPVAKVVFRVGPTPDRQRTVCACVFLAQFPISRATLTRIVQRKRIGADLYSKIGHELRKESINVKTLHVISWTLEYANQESAPRCPPTPHTLHPHPTPYRTAPHRTHARAGL